jgi:Helix-turn-helix domain
MKGDRAGNTLMARLDFYEAMSDARIFSPAALRIAHKLLYRHLNGTTGRCDPARATLAKETGMSKGSVQRAIGELEGSGWWQISRRGSGAGRGHTNSYRPNYEKGLSSAPFSMPEKDSDQTPFNVEKRTQSCSEKDSTLSPKPGRTRKEASYVVHRSAMNPVDESDSLGEVFWRAYPSRAPHPNPKKPALLKFEAAVKRGVDPTAIIRGVENYARYVERHVTDPQRVAQAVTWLGQERWNDHQEVAQAPRRRLGAGLL